MKRTHAFVILGVAVVVLAGALALFCAGTVESQWLLLAVLLLVIGAALAAWEAHAAGAATDRSGEPERPHHGVCQALQGCK